MDEVWLATGSLVLKRTCAAWGPQGSEIDHGRMFPLHVLPAAHQVRVRKVVTTARAVNSAAFDGLTGISREDEIDDTIQRCPSPFPTVTLHKTI